VPFPFWPINFSCRATSLSAVVLGIPWQVHMAHCPLYSLARCQRTAFGSTGDGHFYQCWFRQLRCECKEMELKSGSNQNPSVGWGLIHCWEIGLASVSITIELLVLETIRVGDTLFLFNSRFIGE
jgi:hypothetical protein